MKPKMEPFYTIDNRRYNPSNILHITIQTDQGAETTTIQLVGLATPVVYTRSDSEEIYMQILIMVDQLIRTSKRFYTIGNRHYNTARILYVTIDPDVSVSIQLLGFVTPITYTKSESETEYNQVLKMVE